MGPRESKQNVDNKLLLRTRVITNKEDAGWELVIEHGAFHLWVTAGNPTQVTTGSCCRSTGWCGAEVTALLFWWRSVHITAVSYWQPLPRGQEQAQYHSLSLKCGVCSFANYSQSALITLSGCALRCCAPKSSNCPAGALVILAVCHPLSTEVSS